MKIKESYYSMAMVLVAFLMFNCKKDDNPKPAPAPSFDCVLESMKTSEGMTQYEYDAEGNPLKITRLRPNGSVENTIEIYYNSLFFSGFSRSTSRPMTEHTKYDADLFLKKLPYMAQISLTIDGITQSNYKQYFFFYDSKDRLIKIGQQTISVGDWEIDLNVSYDDKDNVVALQGEYTTGPNMVLEPLTVAAYDDKPTPYSSISFYKFLRDFSWDYDQEAILTALSKNNPLEFTMGTFNRKMSYTYNDQGYPLTRVNTNTNPSGQSTSTQTYTYKCK